MGYQEIRPQGRFSELIDCYWISKEKRSDVYRVLPDGCADIIFNFGDAIIRTGTNENSLPEKSITAVGMMTCFRDVLSSTTTDLLGIRFKSGTLRRLTKVPLHELKNLAIPAFEISLEMGPSLFDQLASCTKFETKVTYIEESLSQILNNSEAQWDLVVSSATDLINQSRGRIKMMELADLVCISSRQLQRRFKAQVGVGIKEYAKIVRFRNAARLIKHSPDQSLLQTAFTCGYYDHAHLVNDFKLLAGTTPSGLR